MFFPRWPLFTIALAAAGCELVLGELPPAKTHHDGGVGGLAGGGGYGSGPGGSGGVTSTSTTSTTTTQTQSGSGGACCDCDGDLVPAKGICGGTDCDDQDERVYPGEPVYYGMAHPDPAIGFDWDCNDVAEQNPALKVVVDCGPIGLPCAAGTGFLGKTLPACGESKPWGTCKQDGLGCVQAVIEPNKVMTCK